MPGFDLTMRVGCKDQREAEAIAVIVGEAADVALHFPGKKPGCAVRPVRPHTWTYTAPGIQVDCPEGGLLAIQECDGEDWRFCPVCGQSKPESNLERA
jgi:hypothetical protein